MITMKPVAAAVAGALISGVAMYTVGARTATVDAFTQTTPALAQTADGQYVQPSQFASPARAQLVSSRPVVRTAPAARRVVSRSSAPVRSEPVVYRGEDQPQRTWQKTAMIIGGSAASGAGVGAIVGGSKGALIGAAIGGGAASIYESTKRR